jgi:pimeloyl-ACP methyl ester carboxylesterase
VILYRPVVNLAPPVFALVIAVSGCGKSPLPVGLPAGAKAGDFRVEHFTFKTGGGAYDAERGVIALPENRKRSGSRLISLPFVRIRTASGTPAEPVYFLGGGPGSPNILSESPLWVDSLLTSHDFIMVGYRGAEGSTVLNCPEVSEALRGLDDDILGSRAHAALSDAMSSSAKRFYNDGIDLRGYTVEEVAEDLDAMHSALDCGRVSLLSMSYGTRVALVYSYLHPDHIRRSVMVGANPPGHFVWEPDKVDEQLRQYAGMWEKDPGRANPGKNLAEVMRRVAHAMPDRWLIFPIDRGKVRVVTFALLFHRKTAAMVFDAYNAADSGDPSGLALISMIYNFVVPKMCVWGDFFAKGSTDFDSSRTYAAEMDPPGSILGSPLSLLIWSSVAASNEWPVVSLPDTLRRLRLSDIETLVISGSVDFSTPAEAATKELLPSLARGKQVILSEMGHCADMMGLQPEAFAHLVTGFYRSGTADASLFVYSPMDFRVQLGFPALAKIVVCVAFIVLAGFAALGWSLTRWFRRRKLRESLQTSAGH